MNVRAFRNATIPAAFMAFLLILFSPLSARAQDGDRSFAFVAFSQAPTTMSGVQPRIAMQGSGRFNATAHEVEGGGTFGVFDNAGPVPPPPLLSGLWKAKEFVSYTPTSDQPSRPHIYGRIESGILVMKIDLALDNGQVVQGVTFRLICNIGFAGVTTGEPEGFVVTIPPYGDFRPLNPILGITHLSTVNPGDQGQIGH